MSIPLLLPTLAARFVRIILGMHYARPTGTAFDRREMPLLLALRALLRRMAAQFAAIVARAEAGTLRRTPRRKAGPPAVQRFTWPRRPRALPSGYMWMTKLAGWTCPGGYSIYQLVLESPEMAALIEVAPQVKRLLRPSCGRPACARARCPRYCGCRPGSARLAGALPGPLFPPPPRLAQFGLRCSGRVTGPRATGPRASSTGLPGGDGPSRATSTGRRCRTSRLHHPAVSA